MIIPDNIASLFNPFDRHIAEFFSKETSDISIEFCLAVMILSHRTGLGDSCISIPALSGRNISEIFSEFSRTEFKLPGKDWIESIRKNNSVTDNMKLNSDIKPFVLDEKGRFYFYRYWEYEKSITDKIKLLLQEPPEFNNETLKKVIRKYFKNSENNDMQVLAAISSAMNRFTVITGGPGTGKTSTVIKILAMLIEISKKNPVIYAAAPTGKAAARLKDSIISGMKIIDDEKIKKLIPVETFTIHRLLQKFSSDSILNKKNPTINADIIVIDETSMTDASLAAKLLNAVPETSRLILLGDSGQLSSVEAGSVFADITGSAGDSFQKNFINSAEEISGLKFSELKIKENKMNSSVIRLNKNYRFSEKDGIYALSTSIRNGDSESSMKYLKSGYKDIEYIQIDNDINIKLSKIIKDGFLKLSDASRDKNPEKALDALSSFSILCAVKNGLYGTEKINENVAILLNGKKLNPDILLNGTPVMIDENDYGLNLFNGDTGIAIEKDNSLSVYFQSANTIKTYSPAILPSFKISYAVTVHKSQGSEFNEVLIILPDTRAGNLSRELFYTAVTRARHKAIIVGTDEIIKYMIEHPMERNSGLGEMLWT